MRALIVFCMLLSAGCSQNGLLARSDYQKSQQDFVHGDAKGALQDFPRGLEEGTFITTMEKGYLSLIQGKPQIQGLQKQAALQENQVRYHVSREARTFFYVQTPEDYYASEHEVIWLHFLLSWGYSLQGKYEDACVEARVAGSLLTLPWAPDGHFDDPAMRLFLAGLWAMCGEWREAQVDLRAAWVMDNSLAWAKELAERDRPPAHLFMVLGGPGPEVAWAPEMGANPLRSGRQVRFALRGRKSALSMADQRGMVINAHLSPDAGKWYERHLARESELHEVIEDSAYGGKAAASGTLAAGWIVGAAGLGIVVAVGGTALGAVIVNAAAQVQSGQSAVDLAKLGIFVAGTSIAAGVGIAQEGYEESTTELKRELDPSIHYRYVRYLPEYLWMGWSDQVIAFPVRLSTPSEHLEVARPSVVHGIAVTVAHLPDGRQTACSYRIDRTSTTVMTAPDAAGNCPQDPDW